MTKTLTNPFCILFLLAAIALAETTSVDRDSSPTFNQFLVLNRRYIKRNSYTFAKVSSIPGFKPITTIMLHTAPSEEGASNPFSITEYVNQPASSMILQQGCNMTTSITVEAGISNAYPGDSTESLRQSWSGDSIQTDSTQENYGKVEVDPICNGDFQQVRINDYFDVAYHCEH